MTAALHIHQLNKHFANGKHALRDINLTVQRGEMVALIGASGSGKSTLLRHVAGLVVADAASDSLIEVDGLQDALRVANDTIYGLQASLPVRGAAWGRVLGILRCTCARSASSCT